jgi:hypothetical protein
MMLSLMKDPATKEELRKMLKKGQVSAQMEVVANK